VIERHDHDDQPAQHVDRLDTRASGKTLAATERRLKLLWSKVTASGDWHHQTR
jgi:hypothetical protein